MTTTRKPTIRAFPLANTNYIAAGATKFDNDSTPKRERNLIYTVSALPHAPVKTTFRAVAHNIDATALILPSGYYFHDQELYSGGDSKNVQHQVEIGNIIHEMAGGTCQENIDPTLGAEIQDSPSSLQIAGVTKDRKKVFLYHLVDSEGMVVNNSGTFFPRFSPIGKRLSKIENIHTIDANDTRILSIAGFANLDAPNRLMAMMYSSGEIVLGEVDNNKFQLKMTLAKFGDNTLDKMQLLSTSDGKLILHNPDENKLLIWDLAVSYKYSEYPVPKMYNLSVSTDGKFLTAMDFQDGHASNRVHCFELNSFKHNTINLEKPAADFVIGQNQQVCIMRQLGPVTEHVLDHCSDAEFPGTIDKFLPQPKPQSKFRTFLDKFKPHHHNENAPTTQNNNFTR